MRETLARLEGQRVTVEATVLRYGSRVVWGDVRVPTLCLGPITDATGELLADHCWFRVGKRLAALDLLPGDTVRMAAHVRPYRRGQRQLPDGSVTYSTDYQLVYPSAVTLLTRAPAPVPEPVPHLAPMAPRLSNRERLMDALAGLRDRAEPISLSRLLGTLPMSPLIAIKLLRTYAKTGMVRFTPDGALCVLSIVTTERSS